MLGKKCGFGHYGQRGLPCSSMRESKRLSWDRDNSCHPPQINVIFRGDIWWHAGLTPPSGRTSCSKRRTQTKVNRGLANFSKGWRWFKGVAVDDIRSFVMPDDASMLALQQGPYWTHKSLKYIDVDVFSTQLQNVSRCSIQLAPAVARRKKIRAKRNMRSMPVKIKVVLYPAPLRFSPNKHTPGGTDQWLTSSNGHSHGISQNSTSLDWQ